MGTLSDISSGVKELVSGLSSNSAADDNGNKGKTGKVKKKSKVKKKTPASSSSWADISLPLSIIIFILGVALIVLDLKDVPLFNEILTDFLQEPSAYHYSVIFAWGFFTILMFGHLAMMFSRKIKAGSAQALRTEVELAEFQKQIEFATAEEYALLLYCYQRNIKSFKLTLIDKTVKGILKKILLGLDMKLFINGYYQEAKFLERLNQLDGRTAYAEEEEIYTIKYDLANTRDHMLDIQEDFNEDVIDEMHKICKDYLYDIRSKPKKLLSKTQPVKPKKAPQKGKKAAQ